MRLKTFLSSSGRRVEEVSLSDRLLWFMRPIPFEPGEVELRWQIKKRFFSDGAPSGSRYH